MSSLGGQITLPWPARELSPNARSHFHAKARIAKAYREHAYWLAKMSPLEIPEDGEIVLRLDFYPPDKRRRDLDGMLSSLKSALDGIADAHSVNDHRFGFTLHRNDPVENGRVIVSIG